MSSKSSSYRMLLLSVIFQVCFCHVFSGESYQHPMDTALTRKHNATVAFSSIWKNLGPFRIGTREAVWDADSLKQYGGFPGLSTNDTRTFHSPLTANATVSWRTDEFKVRTSADSSTVDLCVQCNDVDWDFQRSIYGWAALQYQLWTRGELWNSADTTIKVAVQPSNILEFWFNDQHVFGGDFFAFERVPVILDVHPGRNIVNIRMIRDVRAMGGQMPPKIEASMQVSVVNNHLSAIEKSLIIPDVVNGHFASSYASVILSNLGTSWIIVDKVTTPFSENGILEAGIRVGPGQSRPVAFHVNDADACATTFTISIEYKVDQDEQLYRVQIDCKNVKKSIHSPHKFTFLHPSGSVSYAMLRPPPHAAIHSRHVFPVLTALHGAGQEADGVLARHAFDAASDLGAWLLFPNGMSSWSGDDWHTWGFADVQAALQAIPHWINTHRQNWSGPGVYLDKYLITGHSNGGQGTWFTALHQPDRVLAAAPASGYSSIENYVPFILWNEAEPLQNAVLQTVRSSFRHELLIENVQHIPLLVQHGEDDDNVPPYHSRLMTYLAAQHHIDIEYAELPHKGHWFDGAMTTDSMMQFYQKHLGNTATRPNIPDSFSYICSNSDDFGSRYGIFIDQLESSDKLGRIDVESIHSINSTFWRIKTTNVHRLHFDFSLLGLLAPEAIHIDQALAPVLVNDLTKNTTFVRDHLGNWAYDNREWRQLASRSGRQRGALDAILRTRDRFQIIYSSEEVYSVAVQTSRNFLQYFNADSELLSLDDYEKASQERGNIVLITTGTRLPISKLSTFPLQMDARGLHLQDGVGRVKKSWKLENLSGAWLRPLPQERLELILWGWNLESLQHAARMAPTLTGAGQPDFVIFEKSAPWKGHSGTLAMGFFDHDWNISSGSYIK